MGGDYVGPRTHVDMRQSPTVPRGTPPAERGTLWLRDDKQFVGTNEDGIDIALGSAFAHTEILASESVTIPVRRQMTVHGTLIIEGALQSEGQLVMEE